MKEMNELCMNVKNVIDAFYDVLDCAGENALSDDGRVKMSAYEMIDDCISPYGYGPENAICKAEAVRNLAEVVERHVTEWDFLYWVHDEEPRVAKEVCKWVRKNLPDEYWSHKEFRFDVVDGNDEFPAV